MYRDGNRADVKVLLADPCPSTRLGLKEMLRLSGGAKVVAEASNAEETLRLTAKLRPEWIIVDPAFGHPPSARHAECLHWANWANLCRELKSLPDPPGIVVYTHHNHPPDVAALIHAGADHYVHKNVSVEKLAEVRARIRRGERVWMTGPPRDDPATDAPDNPAGIRLTRREREILDLKRYHLSNTEIARSLHISVNTVKHHVTKINKKQGAIRHHPPDPPPAGERGSTVRNS